MTKIEERGRRALHPLESVLVRASPMIASGTRTVTGALLLSGPRFDNACLMEVKMSLVGISVVLKETSVNKRRGSFFNN